MSVTEALIEGLQVTVVGLAIVFSVLIILMLVLMAMKVVFYKPAKSEEPKKTVKKSEAAAAAPAAKVESKNEIDEGELIAVLTAAVAASLNTSTYNLNIKSYRRIGNTSPSWNKAGLTDVINSRF